MSKSDFYFQFGKETRCKELILDIILELLKVFRVVLCCGFFSLAITIGVVQGILAVLDSYGILDWLLSR